MELEACVTPKPKLEFVYKLHVLSRAQHTDVQWI